MAFVFPVGMIHETDREADARALEEFLANGRKINRIPDSRILEKSRKKRERREKAGKINLFTEKEIYEEGSK